MRFEKSIYHANADSFVNKVIGSSGINIKNLIHEINEKKEDHLLFIKDFNKKKVKKNNFFF